eukprot:TRINITY_DN923_c0_g2_i3.p1 TRINITY_DN923_c0_g2~~TRINITY_DN923_c0_g2_i3.p1  ORF type:complete len:488 (+),score=92.80 TRINITY_DN923_c0_g2_i3:98-1465(+)
MNEHSDQMIVEEDEKAKEAAKEYERKQAELERLTKSFLVIRKRATSLLAQLETGYDQLFHDNQLLKTHITISKHALHQGVDLLANLERLNALVRHDNDTDGADYYTKNNVNSNDDMDDDNDTDSSDDDDGDDEDEDTDTETDTDDVDEDEDVDSEDDDVETLDEGSDPVAPQFVSSCLYCSEQYLSPSKLREHMRACFTALQTAPPQQETYHLRIPLNNDASALLTELAASFGPKGQLPERTTFAEIHYDTRPKVLRYSYINPATLFTLREPLTKQSKEKWVMQSWRQPTKQERAELPAGMSFSVCREERNEDKILERVKAVNKLGTVSRLSHVPLSPLCMVITTRYSFTIQDPGLLVHVDASWINTGRYVVLVTAVAQKTTSTDTLVLGFGAFLDALKRAGVKPQDADAEVGTPAEEAIYALQHKANPELGLGKHSFETLAQAPHWYKPYDNTL